jgi:hypothetical protein
VSTFQHHTKLCSKCSTLLVSSLNYMNIPYIIYVYTIKTVQWFHRFGIPLTVIFTCAARRPAHHDGCGPFPKRLDTLGIQGMLIHQNYLKALDKI